MCKIFLVAGIKPSTVDKVWAFAQAIAKPMSVSNSDGLGYGAITANGNIFGERWLNNDTAFKSKADVDNIDTDYAGAIDVKKVNFEYTTYGTVDLKNMVALTMHTRWATSPKGMMNTHPFVLDDVSLVHNGVIRNPEQFKLESTCDSEAILHAYVQNKVWESPKNFEAAAALLRGYYACGVLINTDQGPFMDIFKANGATLYVTYVKQLETYVHCTSDTDIKNVCKEFGYDHGQMYSILPNKFIRVDAITGKTLDISDFIPSVDYVSGGNSRNFQEGNWMNRGHYGGNNAGMTKNLPVPVTNINNVIPYSKKKDNPKATKEMFDYFKSGRPSCVLLSDREIQMEIMDTEKTLGRY